MLDKRNSIFLLFAGRVNVGEEEGNIMATHKCRQTGIIEYHSISLHLPTIRGLQRLLTLIYC